MLKWKWTGIRFEIFTLASRSLQQLAVDLRLHIMCSIWNDGILLLKGIHIHGCQYLSFWHFSIWSILLHLRCSKIVIDKTLTSWWFALDTKTVLHYFMLLCISFLTALTKFEESNSLIIVTFWSGWKSVMTFKIKIKRHSFYYKTWFQPGYDIFNNL